MASRQEEEAAEASVPHEEATEVVASEAVVTEEVVSEVVVIEVASEEEEEIEEAEVVPEEEEEESVPVPRYSFNLTRDSKASLSYVERTTLSSPRISTQESPFITKNV